MATAAELNVLLKLQDQTKGGLKSFGGRIQNLSAKVGIASAAMAAGIGAVGFKAVMMASDTTESLNKVRVVFGDSAKSVEDFAETAATALRASRQEVLEAAGTFGNLLIASGQSEDAAAKMSIEIVQLGADLASFNNIDSTVALEKLRSGLIGQAEPLQSLGVTLTVAKVALMGLEMGLVSAGEEMTESQKQTARLAIIMKDTTKAHGDASRTAGEFAGSMEGLKATIKDVGSDMGEILLPIATDVVKILAELATKFKNLSDPMKKAIVIGVGVAGAIAGLAVVIGPLIGILGGVTTAVKALSGAMTLLAANPIALIVIGLAAAGVAAFKFKEHIDNQAKAAREAATEMVELADANDLAARAASAGHDEYVKMLTGLTRLVAAIDRVSTDSRQWAHITDAQREALAGLGLEADSSKEAFDNVRRSVTDQIDELFRARSETNALAAAQRLQAEESDAQAAKALELEKQVKATAGATKDLRESVVKNMFKVFGGMGIAQGIDATTLALLKGGEEAGFFAEGIDEVAEAARIAKKELQELEAASDAAAAAALDYRDAVVGSMFRVWESEVRGYARGVDQATMAQLLGHEEAGHFAESIDEVAVSSGRARGSLSRMASAADDLRDASVGVSSALRGVEISGENAEQALKLLVDRGIIVTASSWDKLKTSITEWGEHTGVAVDDVIGKLKNLIDTNDDVMASNKAAADQQRQQAADAEQAAADAVRAAEDAAQAAQTQADIQAAIAIAGTEAGVQPAVLKGMAESQLRRRAAGQLEAGVFGDPGAGGEQAGAALTAMTAARNRAQEAIRRMFEAVDISGLQSFISGTLAGVAFGQGRRFAHGGITPGGPVLVGERGPEIVSPPAGSRVSPNVGGTTVIVNVQGSVTSERDLVRTIREGLLRQGRGVTTLGLN